MKKGIFIILTIIVVIVICITVKISSENSKANSTLKYNAEFEQYNGQTIYGADVMSIINKAIDNNKKYNIEKDEDGYYIEDDEHSLKVELTLLSIIDKKGNTSEVEYPMETLEKAGLDGFVASFSLTSFECTEIEYNSARQS